MWLTLKKSLLEEVTSLVEYPNVLAAKFEERFLAVPAEALVYTMKGDQKYFPIYDKTANYYRTLFCIEHQPLKIQRRLSKETKSGSPAFNRCGIFL